MSHMLKSPHNNCAFSPENPLKTPGKYCVSPISWPLVPCPVPQSSKTARYQSGKTARYQAGKTTSNKTSINPLPYSLTARWRSSGPASVQPGSSHRITVPAFIAMLCRELSSSMCLGTDRLLKGNMTTQQAVTARRHNLAGMSAPYYCLADKLSDCITTATARKN